MPELQLVIRLDSEQLKHFRAACILRDSTPTKEIARLVGEQLRQWRVAEANSKETRSMLVPSMRRDDR